MKCRTKFDIYIFIKHQLIFMQDYQSSIQKFNIKSRVINSSYKSVISEKILLRCNNIIFLNIGTSCPRCMMSNAQKSVLNEMINTPIELFSFYTYLLEVLSKSKNKIK